MTIIWIGLVLIMISILVPGFAYIVRQFAVSTLDTTPGKYKKFWKILIISSILLMLIGIIVTIFGAF